MGSGPTNGPYHWGNGPKPTRKAKQSGKGGKGCAVTALALLAGMAGAIALAVYETAKVVIN